MQWVDASPENRETFLKYWHMFDAIHLLHEAPVVLPAAGRRIRMRTWLGYAAAMAVIFAIGYFTSYTGRDTEPVWQEITAPSGQRIHLALANGSTVWLNSNTTLRYDPSFSGKTRRMMVDGEAYFEVSTNKKALCGRDFLRDYRSIGYLFQCRSLFHFPAICHLTDGRLCAAHFPGADRCIETRSDGHHRNRGEAYCKKRSPISKNTAGEKGLSALPMLLSKRS